VHAPGGRLKRSYYAIESMMTERRRHTTTGVPAGPFDIRIHSVCAFP